MKYKCNKCGDIVDEEEITSSYWEDRGEFWGRSCSEKMVEIDYECKKCFGEYEEAYECKICGNFFLENQLYEGYCKECLEDEMTDKNVKEFFKYEELLEEYLELKERKYTNKSIIDELSDYENFAWWLVNIKR